MYFINAIFLFLFLFAIEIKTDLPVHCVRDMIDGEWTFRISKETFTPSLNEMRSSCSHGFPGQIDQTEGDIDYSFSSFIEIKITLGGDYKLYQNGKDLVGNWTPVYDEGFILNYKNSEFTTFMKYYKEKLAFKSNCDKTMIGWYIPDKSNKNSNWSCFFGFKSKVKYGTNFVQIKKLMNRLKTKLKSDNKDYIYYKNDPSFLEKRSYFNSIKYEDQKDLVNEINSNENLTWKADFNQVFKGLTLLELYNRLGSKNKFMKSFDNSNLNHDIKLKDFKAKPNLNDGLNNQNRDMDSKFQKDYNEVIKYIDAEIDSVPAEKLPKNWDWRDVGGINYVPSPKSQLFCGSCYVFSSLLSLQSRLMIKTNNQDKTEFSVQYVISCNFYTEGCEGGYPILVGKFLNEFEILPESCFPYQAWHVKCSNRCDNSNSRRKYFVSKYEYLGGYYGNTSEEDMMKEIRARGPIPGNMMVPFDFSLYRSGIYSKQKENRNNNQSISKRTIVNQNILWKEVTHSIILVGWGEEKGVKYWIAMNTWGTSFGENGFFKLLRGENDCNIETMGDNLRLRIVDV